MRKHLNDILDMLDSGERSSKEIFQGLDVSKNTARKYLNLLMDEKKVVCVKKGLYDLHEDYRPLTPLENRKLIKDLIDFQRDTLSIYRQDLNVLLAQPNVNPVEKQRLLECIKTLALSVDRMLKRWNLLTQGYDTNTQQAQEDAKMKTEDRQKADMENVPPEDRVVVVGDYHESVRGFFENLPKAAIEKRTV